MSLAKKIVYIAGPLNGDVDRNVKKAEFLSDLVAKHQIGFFCPHYRGQKHFALGLPEEYWIEYGLEMVRRSDAVLLVPGWKNSKGTRREIEEAENVGIPVFEKLSELKNYFMKEKNK